MYPLSTPDQCPADASIERLFELSRDLLCVVDVEGIFCRVNPAFTETLGWAASELVAQSYLAFLHPADNVRSTTLKGRTTGIDLIPAECRWRCADGSYRWLSWRSSSPDDDGLIYAVARDVTETKRVQAELYALHKHAAVGIAMSDCAGKFLKVNPAFCEMLGYSEAELLRMTGIEVTAVDDRAAQSDYMGWLASGTLRSTTIEKRYLRKDGSVIWGRVTLSAILDETTPQKALMGVVEDITESKRTEIALLDSEQRYRSLFENHPEAVFLLDRAGRFLSSNPACAALCGYEMGEMVGEPFDALVSPDQIDNAYTYFKRALEGAATTYEITLRRRSGDSVEISVTNIPMLVSGEIAGVFGVARDLTRQRELEAQLRHSQKMEAVGQLAAGVAHDFNNVLTVIQGCSEFLRGSLPIGDERRDDVDMIRDAASRAATLTRQLLAFSRKQVLEPSVIDLNGCIEGLQSIIARMLGEDIVLAIHLASDLGFISADAGQLEQVIVNMTVNARDAMPNGGELRLTTSNCVIDEAHARQFPDATSGPHIRLSILDTGCGMDEVTLSRIFEPFFTTKCAGKGTGLGLATAYGIIRQSSGHIAVTSTPGVGTTFDIYLPMLDGEANPPSRAAKSQPRQYQAGRGHETILLVEDDASVRSLASQMLTRDGYGVVEATNGAEALDTVRAWNGNVDLVVTDAMMPVMNGGELAEALATEYPRVKVLFMSLYTGDDIVKRGADSRRAFIPKPFTTADLTEKVREVLDAPWNAE